MEKILVSDMAVKAEITLDSDNRPHIRFFDPAYIRAEKVLFNKKDRSVHAVLYEGQFLIGHVPEELNGSFEQNKSITLCANHFSGKEIRLTANLIHQ